MSRPSGSLMHVVLMGGLLALLSGVMLALLAVSERRWDQIAVVAASVLCVAALGADMALRFALLRLALRHGVGLRLDASGVACAGTPSAHQRLALEKPLRRLRLPARFAYRVSGSMSVSPTA